MWLGVYIFITLRGVAMASASNNKEVTKWVGWIAFAGFMTLFLGVVHLIAGFVALFKDDVYVATNANLWVLDFTSWGWAHILFGALAIWASSSLMQGKYYGRTFAVVLAMVSAAVNVAFIPVYPIWSIMMVTVAVLVIWATIVHGDELRES